MNIQRKSVVAWIGAATALSLALTACANDGQGTDSVLPDDNPAATAPPADSAPPASEPPATEATPESPEGTTTAHGADLATTEFAVSWREAVDAAMANFAGELTEIEFEWTRDRYAYEVELVSDGEEYEVRIDADTGEQFDEDLDRLDGNDVAEKQAKIIDLDAIVSWEDALAAALEAVNGTVSEWQLEGTRQGPQYEFDIDDDSGRDYEVTVDALTAQVIEIDD